MKVKVDSNFEIRGIFGSSEVELEGGEATLRDLLEVLSQMCGGRIVFVDPQTGEVDPDDFGIHVNGSSFQLLPQKVNTRLHDGDRVSLTMYLAPLGGG